MEQITKLSHSKETFLYAASRLLERAAYYGLRSIIILYMIDGVLKMESVDAIKIYGWLSASLVLSQIIGAILGDLLIGNRKAIILGGIIQSIGAFSFCFPTSSGLYTGLILVVLGGGLYTPNMISNFGKLYLNKTKLLDAGFTLYYLAINIGAFFGALVVGYIGEVHGWSIGFAIAGVIMLLSITPIFFVKSTEVIQPIENKANLSKRIINITIAFIAISLFWTIYEIGSFQSFQFQFQLSEISTLGIPKSIWSSISTLLFLPISIFAIILWTYYYSTQFFKLMLGFIFGAIQFGILFLIPESPSSQHAILYLISLLFLCLSEIYIGPIIHSILTQYTNPKYLAIVISLVPIPIRLFSFIFSLFSESLYEQPPLALLIGLIAMSVSSIGLLIYYLTNKKQSAIKEDQLL